MIALVVGTVTTTGLLITFCLTRHPRVDARVHTVWWGLFTCFLGVNLSYALNLPHEPLYGVPAAFYLGVLYSTFGWRAAWPIHVIAFLFVFNIVGNAVKLDAYKFATADALDLAVWMQIGLLLPLSRRYRDQRWIAAVDQPRDDPPEVLRLVYDHRKPKTAHFA